MKKHALFIDLLYFSALFIGFLIPPLLESTVVNKTIFTDWKFNIGVIISLFISLVTLILYYEKIERKNKNVLVMIILPATFVFSTLFTFSLIFKFITVVKTATTQSTSLTVKLPQTLSGWFFCIFQFFVGAFYEELIYRFYVPEAMHSFVNSKNSKILNLFCEIIVLLLFGFAHRYLGMISVLNACIAHVVLRFAFVKTKSLTVVTTAHFAYNMVSLILL